MTSDRNRPWVPSKQSQKELVVSSAKRAKRRRALRREYRLRFATGCRPSLDSGVSAAAAAAAAAASSSSSLCRIQYLAAPAPAAAGLLWPSRKLIQPLFQGANALVFLCLCSCALASTRCFKWSNRGVTLDEKEPPPWSTSRGARRSRARTRCRRHGVGRGEGHIRRRMSRRARS